LRETRRCPYILGVAIKHSTSRWSEEEFLEAVDALTVQFQRDVLPYWSADVGPIHKITPIRRDEALPDDSYWMGLVDHTNGSPGDNTGPSLPGHAGTHEVSAEGRPIATVFLGSSNNWSVPMSHELLDMVINPYLGISKRENYLSYPGSEYQIFKEIADPDENNWYSIGVLQRKNSGHPGQRKPIHVSNFVYPSWFGAAQGFNDQFDYMGLTEAPFAINGYIVLRNPADGGLVLAPPRSGAPNPTLVMGLGPGGQPLVHPWVRDGKIRSDADFRQLFG
jgi:hypothetical protein